LADDTTSKDAMAAGRQITLRLTIGDPVPGVAYSLQNKKSEPVGVVIAPDGADAFATKGPNPREGARRIYGSAQRAARLQ
jgi:hypothetical protein